MSESVSLIFADVETGTVLDKTGSWAGVGGEFNPGFTSRSEAEAFMTSFLDLNPHAECWISSDDAKGIRVVSPKFEAYFKEKTEWMRWRTSSWIHRILTAEPIGRYYQPNRR